MKTVQSRRLLVESVSPQTESFGIVRVTNTVGAC